MKTRTLISRLVLGLLLAVPTLAGYQNTARAQETVLAESPYQEQVAALMEQMDVRDRVGQLFLITFVGDQATPDSAIADLLLNYRVGGVVLLAANDNITDDNDPPTQVAGLINDLQTRAYEVSLQEKSPSAEGEVPPPPSPFIPLLVAIDHEGDNSPFSRLLTGMTEIPSSMAIGATWNTEHAQTVGRIVGAELSALGINMVLGPSLDVLETPRPESPGGLGTRTFGGDPYWVGMMGQAYIAGVHEGSSNQMAVVAKHFPGHGGSDRQPDQEVSTVRKSLGELRLIELAPFVSVTGGSSVPTYTTDALMTSHIRYQGFQGNIRESTRPISFDPQALETIMELPEFAAWRSAGGVIVSDALGVRAVKRFYDPQLQEFPHRQIAQDAFLAGNDVLLLSEFAITSNYVDQVANIKDTLDWFYDNYTNDAAFQARVDRSVERILNLKLGLYDGDISVDNVLVPVSQVADQVGNRRDEIVLLAQDAITLLAPGPEELADRIPSPPNKNDYVTIFTDLRYARQCTTCQDRPLVGVSELQNAILRLYGPDGTNQVLPGHLNSFSFQELEEFLQTPPAPPVPTATPEGEENTGEQEEPTPEPPPLIETALERADWIIFAMLDVAAHEPQSDAVKTFLAERPDIASNARIIVLAFNAPYFLDTTDISKLTAYYGIYSKIEPFVEAGVKAVFQQFKPPGSPPVDIMGTAYKLTEATSSSPDQIIQLFFDQENGQGDSSADPPDLRVGDSLRLRTGVIIDNNGNPVPDGTPVQFTISYLSEGLGFDVPQPEVHTVDGTARISILLNVPGQLQIKASSSDARASVGLAVTVFEDQPPIIEEITPLPTNTPSPPPPTPTQTATPLPATPTPTPTATPTSTPAPIIVPWVGPEEYPMGWNHLSEALVGVLLVGLLGLWLGFVVSDRNPVWGLRLALMGVVAGLLGYNFLALQLPGADQVSGWAGVWGVPLMTWGTGLCGVAAGWIWLASTDLEAERGLGPGQSLRD